MVFLPVALYGVFWVLTVLGFITLLVFLILSLVAAMNCLEQCRRRNREMDPGHVWLTLIPAFGAVWIYFVIIRVEQALRREYRDRELRRPKDFGQPLGLAAVICWQAGALLFCVLIGVFGVLAAAGIFVAYWQRLAKHHKELVRSRRSDGSYDEEDDEDAYDDRPRRRSRRDRDDEEEGEDDRPRRRRSRRDEEEDDERPRRRSRRDDEDDEDEPPRRSPPPKPDDEGGWKK